MGDHATQKLTEGYFGQSTRRRLRLRRQQRREDGRLPKTRDMTKLIRLSQEEMDRLEKNAKSYGCSSSELIRRTAIYGQKLSPVTIDMEPIKMIRFELQKQGGNLNQMMKVIHTYGLPSYNPQSVQKLITKLEDAIESVHSLIIDIRNGNLNL